MSGRTVLPRRPGPKGRRPGLEPRLDPALDQVLREPLEGGSAGYAGAWWRKGQILQTLGRRDDARAAAREALKLDPSGLGSGGGRRVKVDPKRPDNLQEGGHLRVTLR